ncbi:MAG: small multi-drug export protein, partial [Spirochaetota bacterium]
MLPAGPHRAFVLYLIALLGIWKAVPAGVFFHLSPLLIWLITFLGALTSSVLIYLFGGRIKRYIMERTDNRRVQRKLRRIQHLIDRFGLIGLGLVGTITVGPAASVAVGLVVTEEKRKLLLWVTAGNFFWSTALTALAILAGTLEKIAVEIR